MSKATGKATNTTKAAKRAARPHLPMEKHAQSFVACYVDCVDADGYVQEAKALWDAARMQARRVLDDARRAFKGKAFDAYKALVRAGLVKARVCRTTADAGRMLNNALIALGATGNGAKKGGKRKGAGRKASDGKPVVTVLSDKAVIAANLAAVNFVAAWQKDELDSSVLEKLGELLAILTKK